MKKFVNYYLIITQILSFMIMPGLLTFLILKRLKADMLYYYILIPILTILGIISSILYALKVFKKEDKKENNELK